jgi:hypothetical protein
VVIRTNGRRGLRRSKYDFIHGMMMFLVSCRDTNNADTV